MGASCASVSAASPKNEGSADLIKDKDYFVIPGLNQGLFQKEYKTGQSLAPKVTDVTNLATGVKYVMYSLSKRNLPCRNPDQIVDVLATLRKIDHQHVCRLIESFDDGAKVILIYECCDGGTLLDELADPDADQNTEEYISVVARQIVSGVSAAHEEGVAHGFLAPKNLLLTSTHQLKITDLGLADVLKKNAIDASVESMHHRPPEKVAKPHAVRPVHMEVARGDIWSLGAIVYQLLAHQPPFQGKSPKEIGEHIKECNSLPQCKALDACSKPCKDFLTQCMQPDPQKRPTAIKLLDHPWIKAARELESKYRPSSNSIRQKKGGKIDGGLIKGLKTYGQETEFKKQMMKQIATNLPRSKIIEIEEAFHQMDLSGDGYLTLKEFKEGLTKHSEVKRNIPTDKLQDLFATIDTDGGGKISIREFIASTIDSHDVLVEDLLWKSFQQLDRDHNGTLSVDELRNILQESEGMMSSAQVEEILQTMNNELKGKEVSFKDFMTLLNEEGGKAHRGKPGKQVPIPEVKQGSDKSLMACCSVTKK